MRVLACPGQGSQSAGFLAPWLDGLPGLAKRLAGLSAACNLDLISLGVNAGETEIRDTAKAQPLIVGSSVAIARELFGEELENFQGVVGHSVGEFTAAALAGVISDEEAMELVAVRALAMARASDLEETSMAALIGLDLAAAEAAASAAELEIANYNGAGQFVLAGKTEAIESLIATPPEGARVVGLKVAGAFHTEFMRSAVAEVAAAAAKLSANDPRLATWSNRDGTLMPSGAEVVARLVTQVASPVRFDLCLESIAACEEFVELPPAGALSGLAKRALSANVLALRNPTDHSRIGAP